MVGHPGLQAWTPSPWSFEGSRAYWGPPWEWPSRRSSTWPAGQPLLVEARSPHLGHILQQADVDGDQAREALVGKTQAFHKEQQLGRAARVLDHVVELPAAQDVDITLAEKRVWREKDQGQVPPTTVCGAGSLMGDAMEE